jgi:hypothetical protein
MKSIILKILILICHFSIYAQTSPQIDTLYRNSYTVFELERLPNGMYRDSKLFIGTDYHPISIANTGMGLISLCIADSMGWINNAEQLALATLKTVTGNTAGFIPDRTSNGYYRHFMNINTGTQAWNSEYSTIDTGILVSGALFCMKYFQNSDINQYAMELWNSINFDAAIANPLTGQIYLSMNADGSGVSSSLTSPYNEYMIVAWLAKNYSNDSNSPGNTLWNNHYNSTNSFPAITYNGYSVLSDNGTSFLSSFTHQFNYYLCHYFTTSNEYLTYFENSQKADSSWWATTGSNSYEWGLGAGSAINPSYHADAINNNNDQIVSPHIIAGYIPINQNGKDDLIILWNNNLGKYTLPTVNNDPILWRYSRSNTTWLPNEITGVDHATMLFGLSTLPEYLGSNFFSRNNDFFPLSTVLNTTDYYSLQSTEIFPNPTNQGITIQLNKQHKQIFIHITNIIGQLVYHENFYTIEKVSIPLQLKKGVYFITIGHSKEAKTFKIIKL